MAAALPLRSGSTAGQAHDTALVDELLGNMVSDAVVITEKAYGAHSMRHLIGVQRAAPNNRDGGCKRDRHSFSSIVYYARNRIVGFFSRIKHLSRIANRHEKHASNDLAMIKRAAIGV